MYVDKTKVPPPSTIAQATMLMRIVAAALLAGPLVLTIVALALIAQKAGAAAPPVPFLGPLSAGLLFVLGPAALLVPRLRAAVVAKTLADEGPAPESWEAADVPARQAILGAWMTNGIISMAMWEGLAMIGATFLLIGRDHLSLAPVVVGVVGVASQFPTTAGVQAAADRMIEAWRNARDARTSDR